MELVRHAAVAEAVRRALNGVDSPAVDLTTISGRVLSAKVTSVKQSSGQVELAVVVFHDITELRLIERMRRDFVANVSHEFKTPLTSIRGYAETLMHSPPDDSATAVEFLGSIERNAELLQALVDDLLVLAELESEVPVHPEHLNVEALIAEQIALRGALIQERQIEVTVECGQARPWGDRTRFLHAFSNILDNAIYYNRPGGRIRIAGREKSGAFAIEITDTGIGIPQDKLSRIFERFYRVEKSRTRQSGGTGLGLAIARHAMESQGGSISVVSSIGVGSTFTITMPMG